MGAGLLSDFTVFPAIDLRGGRCVRLVQGDFERSKEYDADPVERAREWERRGARALHVVDSTVPARVGPHSSSWSGR